MSTTIPDYSSKQWMVNHPDSHPPPIQTQIAFLQGLSLRFVFLLIINKV